MTTTPFALCLAFALASQAPAPPQAAAQAFELVESAPIETSLDHPELRNADVVWLELVRGAKRSLDFAEFYASDLGTSRLTPILEALEEQYRRQGTPKR